MIRIRLTNQSALDAARLIQSSSVCWNFWNVLLLLSGAGSVDGTSSERGGGAAARLGLLLCRVSRTI